MNIASEIRQEFQSQRAKQRRKKRPGSTIWAYRFDFDDKDDVAPAARHRWLASAAIAGALVVAGGAFAVWSSRRSACA